MFYISALQPCFVLYTVSEFVVCRESGPAEQLFKDMETKDAAVYGSLIMGRAKVGATTFWYCNTSFFTICRIYPISKTTGPMLVYYACVAGYPLRGTSSLKLHSLEENPEKLGVMNVFYIVLYSETKESGGQ